MEVGREDFEAGHYGNDLQLIMQCLPSDKAWTEREIQNATGLETKLLNYGLPKLVELGRIEKKWLGAATHYCKVLSPLHQEWYTIDEAANYLRVSRRTIYQLIEQGELACYRVGKGGHRRFWKGDLQGVMSEERGRGVYAMNAASDPVLAELWDNEKDAEYDLI
jgi:excisionase family DNA binding protein